MQLYNDPDEYESTVESTTCEYHKRNPRDLGWPGCTCSVMYGSKRRSPEAVRAIKAARQRKHEEQVLAEADAIRARRAAQAAASAEAQPVPGVDAPCRTGGVYVI